MISNEDIIRLCELIKMKSGRDIENTSVTIFRAVIKISDNPISSSTISYMTGMHRLTVRHHLQKMKDLGFLVEEHGRYLTKFQTLAEYIRFRKREIMKKYEELEELAYEIDKENEQEQKLMGEYNVKRRFRE